MHAHERLADRLRAARSERRPALVAFLTAGYPDPARFVEHLDAVCEHADAVEIGVPFTDPMADGMTIQRASQGALANGVSLRWILDRLGERRDPDATPLLLMSYLNPLLAYGYDDLAARAAAVGVCGFIVPDLPLEESAPFTAAVERAGTGLVQMVTPATPPERARRLCEASRGFVYAVTVTGITGGGGGLPAGLAEYLERLRGVSPLPVCAGFGIREAAQVRAVGAHADGVIVGSALVEALERGDDPAAFLRGLLA